MKLHCCGCSKKVSPRLTDGSEIYPARPDLVDLPFWKCDTCGNYVGCHHKTKDRTRPLGCIPTPKLRKARQEVHKLIDPYTRENHRLKRKLYKHLSGPHTYHTAEIRSVEDARAVYEKASLFLTGEIKKPTF